ncbi:SusC/RagA family TonB-linked outer membrane protein [Sphingobacterium faecale]|uniref:SusC/RagA family TonB-linked outer membrane protein n=1 Tax=Sphingobacterium faecale TaxID=2803775 RepID=A0ABS1R8M5_9SPHI|nr:SusC/RagA family TonB-linked outer membrane protein [Sphingobacterium faecale]MBL1410589.1 SusC/RagA family TonB-linked outer membrane protein [Sphingobacterium faecale]
MYKKKAIDRAVQWDFPVGVSKILRVMKLTVLLTILALVQVSAKSFGQISLNKTNIPLEKVFSEIEKQSGYVFFYKGNLKNIFLNVNFKDQDINQALAICFKGLPLEYRIVDKNVVVHYKANAGLGTADRPNRIDEQQKVIKGTVRDVSSKPMVSASVSVKGRKELVTVTDGNGEFVLKDMELPVTLVVSYIGFKSLEIPVKSYATNVNIILEVIDNKMDELVISTGIFKKADKSFTGSSITVSAEELKSFGNRNMIVSLSNIDPSFRIIENNNMGSNPNMLPDIQIRGNSSLPNINNLDDIVGLNTPLIILDGFQSSLQKMLDININEVESVTILKDASATSIYGSRGSNGVIVITTKLPKPGALRISYATDLNLEVADLSGYRLLDAREKLELERKAGLYNSGIIQYDLGLKNYYNSILNDINSGVNTDWLSIPLRTGVGQRHNLSLSGGVPIFRYSASVQFNNIEGVMKGSARNTFNGTVNLAYSLKNFRLSNQVIISEGRSAESKYGAFRDYVKMNPYWNPYDSDGNVLKLLGAPKSDDYTQILWPRLPGNPMYNATLNGFDKSKLSEVTNNTSLEWSVFTGLTVRAQLGLTKLTEQGDKFRPADHTAFANYAESDLFRRGDYNYRIGNGFKYDGALNVQFSRVFKEKHILFSGVDFGVRQDRNSRYGFLAEGFTNPNFDFISMALQYAKDQKPSGDESLVNAVALTGNVNYSYDDRYFTDISVRFDGSSQFGVNNRIAPFWSAGLGWNIHNEDFMKDQTFVNRLKLRGSTGITGSQSFNAYQALSTYRYYTDKRYHNLIGAYLLGIGNEDLKWQQSLKHDVGFDAEFIEGRFRVTADYYLSTTRDLVSSISLPASNGFTSYVENIGRMRNTGIEFRTTGILVQQPSNGWYWSVTAAFSHNRNKILNISDALKDAQRNRQMESSAAPSPLYYEGFSTNAIWVVPSLGIDPSNGKEVYLDRNDKTTYVWSGNDLRVMGNSEPKVQGNFSTLVSYRNISLNASFGYRFGGQQYNQTLINMVENADYKYNVDRRVYEERWQKPGDVSFFKGLMVGGTTYKSSRFVQDEKTLVCQNINLQYVLRGEALKRKLKMEYLQITANVAEPFRISSIKQERGLDYPFSKQFSLGLQVTF